jgi:hypothetical protein
MDHRLASLAIGAAVLGPMTFWSGDALGQSYTLTSISVSGSGGKFSASPADTSVTLDESSGTFSPPANRSASQGALVYSITAKCGNQNACNTTTVDIIVRDTSGTISGARIGALNNFTINTQTSASGSNPTTIVIPAIGKGDSVTFKLGFNIPILSTGTTGATVTRAIRVSIAPHGGSTDDTRTTSFTATVYNPISISKTSDMAFGSILPPASGTATVSLSTAGAASTTGGFLLASTRSAAAFTITGEGGQAFSLVAPTTIPLISSGHTLMVSTIRSIGSGATSTLSLSGALGTSGSSLLRVGGTLLVPSGTTRGAYTGSLMVSVNYN